MANSHTMSGHATGLAHPEVRPIDIADLFTALRQGASDFWSRPSHYVFLILIYPVVGVLLTLWTTGADAWPLLYPLVTGFALIGPFAALPLYEVSRRREQGEDIPWSDAFQVMRSPHMGSILALGLILLAIFAIWIMAAQAIYTNIFGDTRPATLGAFLTQVLTTQNGLQLLVVGNLVGLGFAIVALLVSAVAFPLMLDRGTGAGEAIATSARAVLANPIPMLVWGVIVGVLLVLGSIPFFVGLAIVLPILGHATWHLYRKVVA